MAVFGVVLGFGLLTAVPSAGFYFVVLGSLAGKDWLLSILPPLIFALGRSVAFATARGGPTCSATGLTRRARKMGGRQALRPLWQMERLLLALLSLCFFASAVGA